MQTRIEQDGDRVTVHLQGRLDDLGASRLRAHFGLVAEGGWGEVVLDLSQVSFIGSTAIGRLLRLQEALTRRNATLRLVRVPPPIMALMGTMRLDQVLSLSSH